jgi:hypothetical protein
VTPTCLLLFLSYLSDVTSLLTYTHGLLLLQMLLLGLWIFGPNVTMFVMKRLLDDAPPPWAQAKRFVLIKPRHYRKHGRFKTVPAFPAIRLKHLLAAMNLLTTSCAHHHDYILTHDTRLDMKLRHTPWGSTADTPRFSLSYYNVDVPLPKAKWTVHNDWESASQPTFRLEEVRPYPFQPDDDPSSIVQILNFGLSSTMPTDPTCISLRTAPLYFSLLDSPSCFSTITSTANPPLIVDTGASVCITPLRTDFHTYHESTMQIKDLSSSNTVAGEGLLRWNVVDVNGNSVTITLPGYHIPTAEVRLLSPQLLLSRNGGYSHQTSNIIQNVLMHPTMKGHISRH